jgi:tetratricopeptide (TPR) repeat protein
LGKREEALEEWARIPDESPYFPRAAVLSATQWVNSGRYSRAEDILNRAERVASAADRPDLLRTQSRLFRFEGRFDEVRQILRETYPSADDPVAVLKELWLLDHSPMPAEAWKLALERADPDDDRVWLGRANQAILVGDYDEARRWVRRCLTRRPEDPAVWTASLDLAKACGDLNAFWEAARHLPDSSFDPNQRFRLEAWLAKVRKNPRAEIKALRAVVAADPGDTESLERLAGLTMEAGQPEEAAAFRKRKSEIDQAQDRFRRILLTEDQMVSRASDLASISKTLGREFDARAWSELASRQPAKANPPGNQPVLVPAPGPVASGPTHRSLADALGGQTSAAAGSGATSLASQVRGQDQQASSPTRTTALQFVDDAHKAGLDFIFDNGVSPKRLLPETMSGGVAVLDFDGDGWLDVYCVQGGPVDPSQKGPDFSSVGDAGGDRLFRNLHDGRFKDVTAEAGLMEAGRDKGYGLGVTVGDFDNDGDPDLFVTRLQTYALYRNRGDGTFEDATEAVGLAGHRDNPTSAAFADLDNDGDLDLYVCHYMRWDPEHPQLCYDDKGENLYCDPARVEAAPDRLFRNDQGRFVDVTESAGIVDPDGRSLGVVAADFDDDHRVDLYVANDGTANYLFHNKGDFTFEEIGDLAGVAGNAQGGYQAGMGVACGDLDGDGRPDLLVTNFYGEGTTFYQNLGTNLFADRSEDSGLGTATRFLLGFGIAAVDVNNDGRLDILTTNGHVNDHRPFYPYAMPSRVYESLGGGRFADVSEQAGEPWSVARVGRGLAAGDLDNDGRLDALILPQNDSLAYFHNVTEDRGHFLTLRLQGTKSNRDGIGARVILTAGGRRQFAQRFGGGSYQSAGDLRLHFGLGATEQVDQIEVHWPSGQIDTWRDLPGNQAYLLQEGAKSVRPELGFLEGSRVGARD